MPRSLNRLQSTWVRWLVVDVALNVPATEAEFGLPADAIAALRRVLSQYPQIKRALVYGSRAKGNYSSGSDIDLTLEGPELTFSSLIRIETALDDLMLPWKIDLSLLSQIDNPDLLDHIVRVGQPLWIKKD